MNQAVVQHRYSPEEYIEIEDHSEAKYQFFEGKLFAMPGGTPDLDCRK